MHLSNFSEHDDEQHLELLLTEHGVRMPGGHDDRLALVQDILLTVDRDAADALETSDECIAAGAMAADLLALVKGEERDAHGVVLRKRPADDLTGLAGDLLPQGHDLGLGDILNHFVHFQSSFPAPQTALLSREALIKLQERSARDFVPN